MRAPSPRLVIAAAFCAGCCATVAQTYPAKPIRIVTFGGPDAVPRILGQKITESLGKQVIVEARLGAGGTIGAEYVARSPADGYTLAIGTSSLMVTPNFYKLPFDVARDFAPVSLIASTPWIFAANPALPVKSIPELIKLAKARPGQLDCGGPSPGSSGHLIAEMFKSMARVDVAYVPYKSQAAQLTDVIAGHVSIGLMAAPQVIPQMKANKVRALAVTTAKRSAVVPDLPTVAEAGLAGFDASGWYALMAPAGTPPTVITTLHGEVVKAVRMPDVLALFGSLALEPVGSSPQRARRVHPGRTGEVDEGGQGNRHPARSAGAAAMKATAAVQCLAAGMCSA